MFNSLKSEKGKRSPGFVRTFNRIAPTYEERYGTKLSFAHDECLHTLSQLLGPLNPESVLDIGCGTGALLERLYTQWPEASYVGIDPAQAMVNEGGKRRPFATFIQGSAERLPLPTASVDLVVCSMSFGHWHDKSAGLHEVHRLLKPQGMFCLVENAPSGWGVTTLINWLLGTLADYRPEQEVIRLARAAGLENIESQTTDQQVIVATFRPYSGEHTQNG